MDSGSFLFKGHFSKSPITLRIQNDLATFDAIAEVSLTTVVRDVEYKFDELKASRSPVESETKFTEEWLEKWAKGFLGANPIPDLQKEEEDLESIVGNPAEVAELEKLLQEEEKEESSGPFMVK